MLESATVSFVWNIGHDATPADVEWARSGTMTLTGREDGPPLLAPAPIASCARAAVAALAAIARKAEIDGDPQQIDALDSPALLGERAACFGFTRRGAVSVGGSCRIVRCADAWIAINLARADDVAMLPAWLEQMRPAEEDVIAFVSRSVGRRRAVELIDRARVLGLPVARAAPALAPSCRSPSETPVLAASRDCGAVADSPRSAPQFHVHSRGVATPRRSRRKPLVIDLSALWAGPLCSHLLGLAGARVIKVESTRRPDGARSGVSTFYDLMNSGKESVALDFHDLDTRRVLRCLVEQADIVIEGSRPRALLQLGIDAEAIVRACPGMVWVSITGYGRRTPECEWVAFGDDAAAAAGLVAAMHDLHGEPMFCGDAVADPLAGMYAAAVALSAWHDGGGVLLDLSLRDVIAHVLAQASSAGTSTVRRRDACDGESGWEVVADGVAHRVDAPRARSVSSPARSLGADTDRVLAELCSAC